MVLQLSCDEILHKQFHVYFFLKLFNIINPFAAVAKVLLNLCQWKEFL